MKELTPRRVACLQPSATVTLRDLGLLDRVVAATRHCAALVPELKSQRVAIVEDSWTAQAEEICDAKPDLVIASVPYQLEALAEILKAGVRVVALAPRSLEDVYGDIATIGNLMGVPEGAAEVISSMRSEIEGVRKRTSKLARPKVFCEEWGKPILIAQRWVAEMVEAAGGEFLGAPASAICAEGVQVENPEVVVFAWCGAGDRVPAGKMVREREWGYLKAVREKRVYVVRDDVLTTPGPSLIIGLHALAYAIHPELFSSPAIEGVEIVRHVQEL